MNDALKSLGKRLLTNESTGERQLVGNKAPDERGQFRLDIERKE